MGNLRHYINGIRNGEVYFDEKFKFGFILHEVSLLHLLFAILFLCMGNKILGIYNVVVFIGYFSLDYLIKADKYKIALAIASAEVIAHSILTTLLVGLQTGFSLYCFSMIPCVFYLVLTWNVFKKKERASLIYSAIFTLVIGFCFVIAFFVKPITPAPLPWQVAFSVLNIIMSVAAMAEFLILLDWDIMHKSEKMASLNTELDEKANMDPLTKLYNRRFMK